MPNITNNKQLDFYRIVAAHILIDDRLMREHEEQQVAARVRAALATGQNGPMVNLRPVVKEMASQWVDTMVRARKKLIRDAIAKAKTEMDLQRVIYFFAPSLRLATHLHVMRSNALKLDWNKIWKSDPERMAAGKTIKDAMMVAWTNPQRKMARNRLMREFESMKGNF